MKIFILFLCLALLITLVLLIINCFNKDKFSDNDIVIPKTIYQTWFTKEIPNEILEYRNKMLKKIQNINIIYTMI